MEANTQYKIPYVGGYSKDKKTLYIDKDFPTKWTDPKTGVTINPREPLTLHENFESAYLKAHPEVKANFAHKKAILQERAWLTTHDVDPNSYYKLIYDQVAKDMREFKKGTTPADLDMEIYEEDKLENVIHELEPEMQKKIPHERRPDHKFLLQEMRKDIMERGGKK